MGLLVYEATYPDRAADVGELQATLANEGKEDLTSRVFVSPTAGVGNVAKEGGTVGGKRWALRIHVSGADHDAVRTIVDNWLTLKDSVGTMSFTKGYAQAEMDAALVDVQMTYDAPTAYYLDLTFEELADLP